MIETTEIDRRKLFEQVAGHLQREILEGKFKPGDKLPPERDLQLRFGVGKPAVREALITLQRSGLIETGNGAPARVSLPTAESVVAGMNPAVFQMLSGAEGQRQLQHVRLFMEVGFVRHAASFATEEDIEGIGDALERNRQAIGDRAAFIETDVAFHFAFAQIMRNSIFLTLHDAMSAWLAQQRRIALMEPDEDRRGYDAHVEIFEAVKAGDPDAAEAAMRKHLESGSIAFWHRFEAATGMPDESSGHEPDHEAIAR